MKNKAHFSNTTDTARQETSRHTSFAEVIQSSLESFTAQCWDWNYFPHFGSLVQTESPTHIIFGTVIQVHTGSMDEARSPFPYQKTEDQLRVEQPQIFEFLKTTF